MASNSSSPWQQDWRAHLDYWQYGRVTAAVHDEMSLSVVPAHNRFRLREHVALMDAIRSVCVSVTQYQVTPLVKPDPKVKPKGARAGFVSVDSVLEDYQCGFRIQSAGTEQRGPDFQLLYRGRTWHSEATLDRPRDTELDQDVFRDQPANGVCVLTVRASQATPRVVMLRLERVLLELLHGTLVQRVGFPERCLPATPGHGPRPSALYDASYHQIWESTLVGRRE